MKKLLILGAVLATLSLGSCARKANCPAYGSAQNPRQQPYERKKQPICCAVDPTAVIALG